MRKKTRLRYNFNTVKRCKGTRENILAVQYLEVWKKKRRVVR